MALAVGMFAVGIGPAGSGASHALYLTALALVLLIFAAACIVWGDWAEARFNRHDPSQVVADETAGMALTLMFLPAHAVTTPARAAVALAAAFLLFRILDIVKPPPAYQLQRVAGGWGILLDDLMSAVYAGLILWAAYRWLAPAAA